MANAISRRRFSDFERVLSLGLACAIQSCAGAPAQEPGSALGIVADVRPIPIIVERIDARAVAQKQAVLQKCGALSCLVFDSERAAFLEVLKAKPLVLAIGETHAQKNAPRVPSATARFTHSLLPLVADLASDLVLELWVANGQCGQPERQVASQQRQVSQSQTETNQSEFVALGDSAKRAGMTPHALVPTCEEYRQIARAGNDDIARMLQMIAARTESEVKKLIDKNRRANSPRPMVVAYGGAMHNDLVPRQGRETWSFGASLSRYTVDRYVELDLIVREFMQDSDAWRALPWYAHFDKNAYPDRTVLLEPSPKSFVLVFPRTRATSQR